MTDQHREARTEATEHVEPADHVDTPQPGHADTGSAAGVGGVTGAAIGAAAGPLGAAVGAVGGMLIGAAAERAMHAGDEGQAEGDVEGAPGATSREPGDFEPGDESER